MPIFALSLARLDVASLIVLTRVPAHDLPSVVVLGRDVRHELLMDELTLFHAVSNL